MRLRGFQVWQIFISISNKSTSNFVENYGKLEKVGKIISKSDKILFLEPRAKIYLFQGVA